MTDEHKSDTVTVRVKRDSHCKVTLETMATAALVAKARKEAVKKVSKKVSVPGFRKGKAPESMILKSFAPAVDDEWQKAIADHAFRDAQTLVHMPILNGNSRIVFDMKNHSMDGAEMVFSFETEPVIPEIKFESIKLHPKKRETIDEKKVEDTLDKIRSYFGSVERITDRPVEEGDAVRIDVNLLKGEELTPVFNNTRFEVREGKMAKWMRDLVLGMKVGEAKDGVSQPDDDASEEEKKSFEHKDVRVTLIAIEKTTLPPMDDEMAQKLGVKNAEEAKDRVTALLNKQADDEVQRDLREQVSERLLDDFPFDVPESVVQREADHRLQTQQSNQHFQYKWKGLSEDERKAEREKIFTDAAKAIRLFYICRKVAQENNLQVQPHDLNQGVENSLDAMFADPGLLNAAPGSEQEAVALSRIMLAKAQDLVISKAKHEEKKAPAKKKTAPAKESDESKPAAKKKAAPAKESAEKKKAAPKKPAAKKPAAKKKPAAEKKTPAKKKST